MKSYNQQRGCLMHFARLANTLLKDEESTRDKTITFLLVTLPNIHRFKKNSTPRRSNKPFLIWLLTTPTHLKYAATLPCNLSLRACFAARYDGIINVHLTANLPRNLPVKIF